MSGVLFINTANKITYVSDELLAFLGYARQEFLDQYGQNIARLISDLNRKAYMDSLWNQVRLSGTGIIVTKVELPQNQIMDAVFLSKKVSDDELMIMIAEQVKNEELSRAYSRYFMTDSLTKLRNREYLEREYEEYNSDKPLALLMMDIDNFKLINDTYGHMEGDSVILKSAEIIKEVFKDYHIARYGGDEFLIFIPEVQSKELIEDLCLEAEKRFEAELGKYMHLDHISLSTGIYYGIKDDTYQESVKKTDIALYNAKARGKNCYVFYDKDTFFRNYQSKRENRKNALYYNMMGRIHAELLAILSSGDDASFQKALSFVGKSFRIDKLLLLERSLSGDTFALNEFYAKDSKYVDIYKNRREWKSNQLITPDYKDGYAYMADVNVMSNEVDKNRLLAQDIQSFLNVEVFNGDEIIGFIWYDFDQANKLDPIEVSALQIVSQVLGVQMRLRRSQALLKARNERVVDFVKNVNHVYAILNAKTFEILCANDSGREVLANLSKDEIMVAGAISHNILAEYKGYKVYIEKTQWDLNNEVYVIY